MPAAEECDYLVIGAGSAGCIVAARLSEAGNDKVVLLEAGGPDDSFWIRTPLGFGKLFENPKYNYCYQGDPEPGLNGARVYQPRGKTLGGTGAINAMVYMRGHRLEYDGWRQLGNTGWSYDDVLPYFKMNEDYDRGPNAYRGAGGPIHVTDQPHHELGDAFLDAAQEAGYKLNDDCNAATREGFGYTQITTRRGRRSYSADEYLRPAFKRSNLRLVLNALTSRIVIKNGVAVGAEYTHHGATKTVTARREVIVCGGAYGSVQMLQLSGVGPAKLLKELGVPVVADLPGVGENLQDHIGLTTQYRCTKPITANDIVNSTVRRLAMGAQYLLFRNGLMAGNGNLIMGYVSTDPALAVPDVAISLNRWSRSAHNRPGLELSEYSGFTSVLSMLRLDSRGYVRINSTDPAAAPSIRFNYLTVEQDVARARIGLRMIRGLMSMPSMAQYVAEEILPGPGVQSDDDYTAYCRTYARSTFHPVGTCKMGVDDLAVVDPRLRVRGVGRLRVIDASIMPVIVGGNTNAPTMMIAEKGAAMIREDARR